MTPLSYVSYFIKVKSIVIATIKYYQLCIIKKSISLFLNCCKSNPARTLLMSKFHSPSEKLTFFALGRGERKRPPVSAAISAATVITMGCRSLVSYSKPQLETWGKRQDVVKDILFLCILVFMFY